VRSTNAKQKPQRRGEEHELNYHLISQIKRKTETFFLILIKKGGGEEEPEE